MGIRTPDIQLAKLALYQLSYTPVGKRFVVEGEAKTKMYTVRIKSHSRL